MKKLSLMLILASVLLASCASKSPVKSSATVNPPPAEAFAAFARFELKPVVLAHEYSMNAGNQNAAAKIQEYFNERVKPLVDGWNARGQANGRTLQIEPVIEQIRFIRIGARIFAGPFAGSSGVLMKVKYTDQDSGKLIAHPEFYQHASAASATMTYGGQDQAMLARIVTLVADYTARNYETPVGGATGKPE
jgi:hypothetical protein